MDRFCYENGITVANFLRNLLFSHIYTIVLELFDTNKYVRLEKKLFFENS